MSNDSKITTGSIVLHGEVPCVGTVVDIKDDVVNVEVYCKDKKNLIVHWDKEDTSLAAVCDMDNFKTHAGGLLRTSLNATLILLANKDALDQAGKDLHPIFQYALNLGLNIQDLQEAVAEAASAFKDKGYNLDIQLI